MVPDEEEKGLTQKMYEWFEESLITQSIVTVMVIGTVCAIYVAPIFGGPKVEMPGELLTLAGLILGYWFKSKDQKAARRLSQQP